MSIVFLVTGLGGPSAFAKDESAKEPWKCSQLLSRLWKDKLKWMGASLLAAGVSYGVTEEVATDPISHFYPCPNAPDEERYHVALVGDSLSTDFHYSSDLATLFRLRTTRSGGWFTDRSKGAPFCFAEECARSQPVLADCHAQAGASVFSSPDASFGKRLGQIAHFDAQLREVTSQALPQHLMVWIGHNDADFAYTCAKNPALDPAQYCEQLPNKIRRAMEPKLKEVITQSTKQNHRMAITVFGIQNFKNMIAVRKQVLAAHERNPKQFPYLQQGIDGFPTLMPQHEVLATKLTENINLQLKEMVDALNSDDDQIVRVFYSSALANFDCQESDISPVDGLHLSEKGHRIEKAAFEATTEERKFLARE